jgi:hypothetical protein
MDADVVMYKGYEIHATPKQRRDSGEWTMEITISRHHEGEVRERMYSAGDSYTTLEEAVAHCVNFGRQVIDGNTPNCSVEGL